MTLKEALAQLKTLGSAQMRAHNSKHGAGDNQFGVKMGDIRKVAAKIKADHELGLALWDTGNIDARLLAILVMKPKSLSGSELETMLRSIDYAQIAEWFNSYIVKKHPDKEALRQKWMTAKDRWIARAAWSLTSECVSQDAEGLDLPALLSRIESEMKDAASEVQWTMNSTLASIGIHFPRHRKRALGIGETLGIYRDYPVSRGCTSPFAPIWINEMVKRQQA